MKKILVIDDHTLLREGLAATLKDVSGGAEVMAAGDTVAAETILRVAGPFDLVLLDLGLPGQNGFDYMQHLKVSYPDTRVAILSGQDDMQTVQMVIQGGAIGFIPKVYSGEEIVSAVDGMLSGMPHYPKKLSGVAAISTQLKREPGELGITPRQTEVLSLLAKGKTNQEIAEDLQLSAGTVRLHITAIFRALGVGTRTQAMVAISEHNIKLN